MAALMHRVKELENTVQAHQTSLAAKDVIIENMEKSMILKINEKGLPFIVGGELKRGDLFVQIVNSTEEEKNLDKKFPDDEINDDNYEFIHIFNILH